MCGKDQHRVEMLDDYEKWCFIDYFCDISFCSDAPDFCPHDGKGPCTCPLEDEFPPEEVVWEDTNEPEHLVEEFEDESVVSFPVSGSGWQQDSAVSADEGMSLKDVLLGWGRRVRQWARKV